MKVLSIRLSFLYLIIFTVSLSSFGCRSFKPVSHSEDFYATWNRDFRDGLKLPETSEFWAKGVCSKCSLWHEFYYTIYHEKLGNEIDQTYWARLTITNGNTLDLVLFQNDIQVDKLKLNGRFDGNYFICDQYKRKSCNAIESQKSEDQIILNLDEEGNLQITNCSWNEGTFLLITGNGGGTSESKYLAKE